MVLVLESAYALAGIHDPLALHQAYVAEDQRLMKCGKWDYNNPNLLTNKIKKALIRIDPTTLSKEERRWRREILWFWFHHAVSCAIWIKKDREAARYYASEAVLCQGKDHPNQITRLLFLLVHERYDEAVSWASAITDNVERETATATLLEYQRGNFF